MWLGKDWVKSCPRALKWYPRDQVPNFCCMLMRFWGSKEVISLGWRKCHWVEGVLFQNTLGMAGS